MGLKHSVGNNFKPYIPYIHVIKPGKLSLNPYIELETKSSTLPSEFIRGKQYGLFTKNFIKQNTIIMKVDQTCMMNDGMVNLQLIISADTSRKAYKAWNNLRENYYDIKKVEKIINVRMVEDDTGACYYESIVDIPAGGELLRMYGFTTWIFEMFDLLTNKNISGFAKFVHELHQYSSGDPHESRIEKLDRGLQNMLIDYNWGNLSVYDHDCENNKIVSMGSIVKMAYIAQQLA